MGDPPHGTRAVDPAVAGLDEALRHWHTAFSDLGRQFGVHLGLHASDAAALVQIAGAEDRDAPLTQAQLARRIGLTAPATSSLLNRLEDAGRVERHRDRADRRVVTLRASAAVHDEVDAFFAHVGDDLDRTIAGRPADLVEQLTGLVQELTGVLDRHLAAITAQRPEDRDAR